MTFVKILTPPRLAELRDRSVCERDHLQKNAFTDVDQTWSARATGDSLVLSNFWWWSGCRSSFSLRLTLADTNFITIYRHSPGGDTAAALSDTAFYMTYIQSPPGDNATALAEFALSECSGLKMQQSEIIKCQHTQTIKCPTVANCERVNMFYCHWRWQIQQSAAYWRLSPLDSSLQLLLHLSLVVPEKWHRHFRQVNCFCYLFTYFLTYLPTVLLEATWCNVGRLMLLYSDCNVTILYGYSYDVFISFPWWTELVRPSPATVNFVCSWPSPPPSCTSACC